MKVLFLIYSPQNTLDTFAERRQTNFPWVDAMVEELSKYNNELTIGLVVPVKFSSYNKRISDGISLYAVPEIKASKKLLMSLPKKVSSGECSETISKTVAAVEDFKPDIIQAFGTENIFGLIQSYTEVPVIIHFQGSVQVVASKWFTGLTKWEQFRVLSFRKLLYRYGNFFEYFTFKERGQREEVIMRNCRYYIGRTSFDRKLTRLFSPESAYYLCPEFIREEFFKHKWEAPLRKRITCISILKGVT